MKTKTTITSITFGDLVNLLATATDGSSWLSCTISKGVWEELSAKYGDLREELWAKALESGYPIYLTDHEAGGTVYNTRGAIVPPDDTAVYRITMEDIEHGIADALDGDFEPGDEDERELAARAAIHLADNSSQFDNAEAEILCQIIMFGSIIYD